jgi:hypothetical protein
VEKAQTVELAQVYLKERIARKEITITTATNHRYILGVFSRDVGPEPELIDGPWSCGRRGGSGCRRRAGEPITTSSEAFVRG